MKHSVLSLALAAALISSPAHLSRAQVRLPALGEAVSDEFGVHAERRLGEQIMREVRRDAAYLDDPLLLEYVQSLWAPLVAAARARGDIGPDIDSQFAWEAFLLRDRSVNAFALPGGYVGVHLGLIGLTSSRDQLASVLAHELSHVTQRHIARSVSHAQRQSMVGMAAMILGVLAASRANSGDLGQAAVIGGQAAMAQGQLNFSRDMEREADRIGWGIFQAAGFAPDGLPQMFEKLHQANRHNDSGAFAYLRSHPLTVERIAEARERVDHSPRNAANPSAALEHAVMQARARVLMDPSAQALRRQQASAAAPDGSAAERLAAAYASALASTLLREPDRAEPALQRALALAEGDARARRAVALLHAQVLIANERPARAAELLDGLGAPDRAAQRAPLLLRAQAALAAARASGAAQDDLRRQTERLQTWVAERREDALAWSLLAQCADQLGLKLRAVRAEAEAHAALGDLAGAIERLRAGQRLARSGAGADFIEASVIDSRLRELENRRRELVAEQRNARP